MRLLLDTCTFLWIITDNSELSRNAKSIFSQPENEIWLSSVSLWELIVKYQLGRLSLPDNPEDFLVEQRKKHKIQSLSLEEKAITQLARLPNYHRDPFDRMLVCQAISNNLTILTPDKDIKQYPVQCYW
jgi:PIN domain nuclease of toxin-antitoxin system